MGTLGSGALYSLVGEDFGEVAGTDAVAGLAACFLAGTISSLLAAVITFKIDDDEGGLKCGPCCTIVAVKEGSNPDTVDASPTSKQDVNEDSNLDTVDTSQVSKTVVMSAKRHAPTQTAEIREVRTLAGEGDAYLPRPPSMSELRW